MIKRRKNIPCDDVIVRYLSGVSTGGIAREYNCSESAIRDRLIEQHIEMRHRGNKGVYKEMNADLVGFIIGMLLGDSCFGGRKTLKCKRIDTEHSMAQEKYLLWKFDKLKGVIGGQVYRRDRFDARTNKTHHFILHHSATHPVIDQLCVEFFADGTKQVTKELMEKLTPEGVAIWFCDDGCLYQNPKQYQTQLNIATNAFNDKSRHLILDMFEEKYGLEFRENKSNGSIRMSNKNGIRKFYDLFGKYIPQCMDYKKTVLP